MRALQNRLIPLMITALLIPQLAAADTKSEVVYANLKSTGAVSRVAVVNKFDLDAAGIITDYGQYESVANLSSLTPLAFGDGTVRVQADVGSFYYEGVLPDGQLPWVIAVSYTLDDQPVAPENLGGRSGRLQMAIDIRKNPAADDAYFENYTLQMQVVLDGVKCKNVSAPDSTVAAQGSDILLTCLLMPGSEKTFRINADVTDFSLEAISANGIPLNVDVDSIDTSEIKDKVSDLQSGIRQLDDGAGTLDAAVDKLNAGTSTLSQSADLIGGGISKLSAGAGQLAAKSTDVVTGLKALTSGLSQLGASAGTIASSGAQLSAGADQLASGLSTLSTQLDALIAGSGAIKTAIGALKDAAGSCSGDISNVSKLISVVDADSDLSGQFSKYIASGRTLVGTLQGLESGLDTLYSQYSAFDGSLAEVKNAVDALETAAGSISGGVTALATPVQQLAGAINGSGAADSASAASDQYAAFDSAVQSLNAGLASLDENYKALQAGIEKLDKNMGRMDKGTSKLNAGTGELKSQTSDMDTEVDDAVDKAVSKFENHDYTPVSFTDRRNSVKLVQFVLRFDEIKAPEAEVPAAEERQEDSSFWGKLTSLFDGWGWKL